MKNIALISLLCALLLAHGQAQDPAIRYEPEGCPEIVRREADELAAQVRCGRLHVPENRAEPKGNWISLFVAEVESAADGTNPPLLFLAGGPGDAASADLSWWLSSSLQQDSDIVLLDQRGTGYSRPSLNCPEYDEALKDRRVADCRLRLLGAGIDLTAYSNEANVADIVDLLLVLKLDTVDLYGKSYGTRLALSLAREIPDRIRSMTLDGAYPPGVNALNEMVINTQDALDRLFADCKIDSACHRAYPRLQEQFYQVVATLDEEPAEIEGLLPTAIVRVTGDDFVNYVRGILADATHLDQLPALITAFARSDYDSLARLVAVDGRPQLDTHSEGVYLSIFCSEDAVMTMADDNSRPRAASSAIAGIGDVAKEVLTNCANWDVPALQRDAPPPAPVRIPTLMLSGHYDPITPPAWAETAETQLAQSWQVVFPAAGHGVLTSDVCAELIMREFLSNPAKEPRHICLQTLRPPQFHVEIDNQS